MASVNRWETGLELQRLVRDELKISVSKESCGNTSLAFETRLRATFFLEQRVGAVTRGDHTPSQHRTASSHFRSISGPSFTPSPLLEYMQKAFVLSFVFPEKLDVPLGL